MNQMATKSSENDQHERAIAKTWEHNSRVWRWLREAKKEDILGRLVQVKMGPSITALVDGNTNMQGVETALIHSLKHSLHFAIEYMAHQLCDATPNHCN